MNTPFYSSLSPRGVEDVDHQSNAGRHSERLPFGVRFKQPMDKRLQKPQEVKRNVYSTLVNTHLARTRQGIAVAKEPVEPSPWERFVEMLRETRVEIRELLSGLSVADYFLGAALCVMFVVTWAITCVLFRIPKLRASL